MFARSAAPPSRPTAIAGQDTAQNSLTGGCATSGPVPTTETRQKRDETLRLVSLEVMAAQLRRMKRSDPRRGELVRAIYSARHEIFSKGNGNA